MRAFKLDGAAMIAQFPLPRMSASACVIRHSDALATGPQFPGTPTRFIAAGRGRSFGGIRERPTKTRNDINLHLSDDRAFPMMRVPCVWHSLHG